MTLTCSECDWESEPFDLDKPGGSAEAHDQFADHIVDRHFTTEVET